MNNIAKNVLKCGDIALKRYIMNNVIDHYYNSTDGSIAIIACFIEDVLDSFVDRYIHNQIMEYCEDNLDRDVILENVRTELTSMPRTSIVETVFPTYFVGFNADDSRDKRFEHIRQYVRKSLTDDNTEETVIDTSPNSIIRSAFDHEKIRLASTILYRDMAPSIKISMFRDTIQTLSANPHMGIHNAIANSMVVYLPTIICTAESTILKHMFGNPRYEWMLSGDMDISAFDVIKLEVQSNWKYLCSIVYPDFTLQTVDQWYQDHKGIDIGDYHTIPTVWFNTHPDRIDFAKYYLDTFIMANE